MRKITLAKDILSRINLGKAFAEHDLLARDPSLFVKTPASITALDEENRKSFYVGRRGAGKTAIAIQLERTYVRSKSITPLVFDLIELPFKEEDFHNTRGRHFKSMVAVFKRALLDELISLWIRDHRIAWSDLGKEMSKERCFIESNDFDTRVLSLTDEIFNSFNKKKQLWLKHINRSKNLIIETNAIGTNRNFRYAIIIDRMDDAWSGTSSSIIALMALLHASLEVSSASNFIRPFVFIRENLFDRVRKLDNEFARLETSVTYLEWSEEKLMELVERRCVKTLNTKPKIGGEAWSYFFQEDEHFSSRKEFLRYAKAVRGI